ncbi:MAG: hypothetical protein ACE5GF_00940 [Thermodesulfobacteriota bacterium]
MLIRITAVILCTIALSAISPAFAEERYTPYDEVTPSPLSLFVDQKTWFSTGDNKWNIADVDGAPNILSELEYLGLESEVVEISGGIRSSAGTFTLRYGFGSMHDGTYRDSDYNSDNRQDIFSLSTGDADGKDWNDLYYFNIEYSYRFFSRKVNWGTISTYLGVIAGYQGWHEEITMTNGFQEVCNLPCTGGTGPFAGLNSRYTFDWRSLFFGLEGAIPLYRGLFLKGNTLFIPYTSYSGEGVWNLRTDFKQNPSFTHEADGGYGVGIDASVGYRIYESFGIEGGYRYWYMKSDAGTDTTFFSDGAILTTRFNEAVSERQGAFLELTYIFYRLF